MRKASLKWSLIAAFVALVAGPAWGADAQMCGSCVCITWSFSYPGGSYVYVEERCPGQGSGWYQTGPTGSTQVDEGGSYGGNGNTQNPVNIPTIPATHNFAFTQAMNRALAKVRGKRISLRPPEYDDNECSLLFKNSPLGMTGEQLIDGYVDWGWGQGTPTCNAGYMAWTTSGTHSPSVRVCPTFFNSNISVNQRATTIIHEALHVAGQLENTNSQAGPGDPPNPSQIDQAIKDACNL